MKKSIAFTFAMILAVTSQIEAQQIKSKTMIMVPSETEGQVSLTVDKGETISKNGVIVKFEPEFKNENVLIGYKYEAAAVDSLKTGDQIALFIHGLDYTLDFPRGARDPSGARVFHSVYAPSITGAFKLLTIESATRAGNTLTISFPESATLRDKKTVKKMDLSLKAGWYTVPVKAN